MLRKHSIFSKLILNILPLWMIPFLIVLAILFNYTCAKTRNDEAKLLENKLNTYMQEVTAEKNLAIAKSDYIINNAELRKYLEFDSEVLVEKFINNNKINESVGVLNNSTIDTIIIYTDNPSIMTGRFTDQIDNLMNKNGIIKLLSQKNQFFFENKVITDKSENQYIRLYRRLAGKHECIIEIKTLLPNNQDFFVTKRNEKYTEDSKYVFSNITKDLIAVTQLDAKALNEKYLRYGLIFFLIGVIFFSTMLIVSMVITNKTTHTINNYISRMSNDDFPDNNEAVNYQQSSWELETIRNAINKLIEENKEKTSAQYRIELEKRRLMLELMQSKFDLHILYNSLATLSLRAYMNKDDELYLLIDDLTDYYRSVLAQGKDFTTVAEEAELAKKFVRINEISHSQKFELQTDISDDILSHRLLHLSLQPFIENSIAHGLAGKEGKKLIRLYAFRDNDKLTFEIYDNGYGMTEEKLYELNNPGPSDTNYAVQNTRERLRIFYDNNFEIGFNSKLNEFTCVKISIPYED